VEEWKREKWWEQWMTLVFDWFMDCVRKVMEWEKKDGRKKEDGRKKRIGLYLLLALVCVWWWLQMVLLGRLT
jgi:hypothetical protein